VILPGMTSDFRQELTITPLCYRQRFSCKQNIKGYVEVLKPD
jgi:hypothetical protein